MQKNKSSYEKNLFFFKNMVSCQILSMTEQAGSPDDSGLPGGVIKETENEATEQNQYFTGPDCCRMRSQPDDRQPGFAATAVCF